MIRFFFEPHSDFVMTDKDELNHLKNVLRAKVGDEFEGIREGVLYYVRLEELAKNEARFSLIKELGYDEERYDFTVIQGLPKGDKLSEVINLSTQAGAHHFIFTELDRSIKKHAEKSERYERIAKSAAMQSKANAIPDIKMLPFDSIDWDSFDEIYFCYEESKETSFEPKGTHFAVVIGPEGGFSEEEVAFFHELSHAKEISLGKRILRTELAATVALTILQDRLRRAE
ncbi:RsmE family RNA methyltransferase [Guggenheimella bovis]